MHHSKTPCHSQHSRHHGAHARGPSSFGMHNSARVFQEIGLKTGKCFLDLGCGSGDYARYAAKIVGKTGAVYALDRWAQMIDELKKDTESQGLKNIHAICADIIDSLPIEDSCIDVGFLATVLHSFDPARDGITLFNELLRVLKPDGQVAIIECKKERQAFGPPEHMRLSPQDLKDILTPYSFEPIDVVDLGNNYLIRFGVNRENSRARQ